MTLVNKKIGERSSMVDYKSEANIGLKIGSYELKEIKESTTRKGSVVWILECRCGRIIEVNPLMCMGKRPKIGECLCGEKGDPKDYITPNKLLGKSSEMFEEKIDVCMQLKRIRAKLLREAAGDRSIKVDRLWVKNEKAFVDWAIKNGYKPGLKLLRADGSEAFNSYNCYWGNESIQWSGHKNIERDINITGVDTSIWSGIDQRKLKTSLLYRKIDNCDLEDVLKESEKYNLNGGITSRRLQKNIRKNINDTLKVLDETIHLIQANNIRRDTSEIRKVQELTEKAYMLVKMAQEEMEE